MDKSKFIREAFPSLVLLGMVEALGGLFLSSSGAQDIVGMLAVIPALISLRGNISGSFASRLGSMAHLGMFDPKHPFGSAKEGIKAAIIMSVSFSLFAAVLGVMATYLSGKVPDAGAVIVITLSTSIFSSIILSSIAVLSVSFSFRHSIDPDNVVVPLLSTFGDLLSLLIMSFFIWLWVVML